MIWQSSYLGNKKSFFLFIAYLKSHLKTYRKYSLFVYNNRKYIGRYIAYSFWTFIQIRFNDPDAPTVSAPELNFQAASTSVLEVQG